MSCERYNFLGINIDNIDEESLGEKILELHEKKGCKTVAFITVLDFLRAKTSKEFAAAINAADLVLPASKSLAFGAKFLKFPAPALHNPFSSIIHIIYTFNENPNVNTALPIDSPARLQNKSIYLLGGNADALSSAEKNVRRTFPQIKVIGRFRGHYKKSMEDDVIASICKSEPNLVLVSEGIKGKLLWCHRLRDRFKTSIFLWNKDIIPIFAQRKRHVSDKSFESGLFKVGAFFRNPLRIFLVFPYVYYFFMLLFARMFKKKSLGESKK